MCSTDFAFKSTQVPRYLFHFKPFLILKVCCPFEDCQQAKILRNSKVTKRNLIVDCYEMHNNHADLYIKLDSLSRKNLLFKPTCQSIRSFLLSQFHSYSHKIVRGDSERYVKCQVQNCLYLHLKLYKIFLLADHALSSPKKFCSTDCFVPTRRNNR